MRGAIPVSVFDIEAQIWDEKSKTSIVLGIESNEV